MRLSEIELAAGPRMTTNSVGRMNTINRHAVGHRDTIALAAHDVPGDRENGQRAASQRHDDKELQELERWNP